MKQPILERMDIESQLLLWRGLVMYGNSTTHTNSNISTNNINASNNNAISLINNTNNNANNNTNTHDTWTEKSTYPAASILLNMLQKIDEQTHGGVSQILILTIRSIALSYLQIHTSSHNRNLHFLTLLSQNPSVQKGPTMMDSMLLIYGIFDSAKIWLQSNYNNSREIDICYTYLNTLLPLLTFSDYREIEKMVLDLCLYTMNRLLICLYMYKQAPSMFLIEMSKSSYYSLLRSRVQNQLMKYGGSKKQLNPLTVSLTQLTSGLEMIQRYYYMQSFQIYRTIGYNTSKQCCGSGSRSAWIRNFCLNMKEQISKNVISL